MEANEGAEKVKGKLKRKNFFGVKCAEVYILQAVQIFWRKEMRVGEMNSGAIIKFLQ